MPRKVVLVAETVMDGVGKHVVDIIEHLNKSEFDLHVIHGTTRMDYRFEAALEKWSGNGVAFYSVSSLQREFRPASDWKAFRQITGLIQAIEPDVVHCHSSKAGVIGRLAAKRCGVPKIYYTPHAYSMQSQERQTVKRLIYQWIERILAKTATTMTFNVSEGERAFALEMKLGDPQHFKVIYNGIDRQFCPGKKAGYRSAFDIPENAFVIGCVSRLYYQKNPLEFLEIAEKLCTVSESFYFIWVGTGEMAEIVKSRTSDAGLNNRVFFAGHQTDVDGYLASFDVFLSTARYEGLPYTLVEAMRAGLPVVATDVIGNNEVVADGVTGFLYEPGIVSDAALHIAKLFEDSALREKQGNAAEQRFMTYFTIDRMIESIESMYR